jgi:hypothetical protein
MQVPYFIKLACIRVYEEEEDLIADYCDAIEQNGDDIEKLVGEMKNNSNIEIFYEDVEITDDKDKVKICKEMMVYIHDNNHSIPLLIIFANKLIKMARDFYEDLKLTDKYHSLINFFELFHSLAEAGPEIRRYMVMNRYIGLLFSIFLDKRYDNNHKLRDLSHIPTYEIICNEKEDEISNSSRNISPDELSDNNQELNFDYSLRFQKRKNNKDYLIVEKEKKGRERKYSDDDEMPSVAVTKGSKESDEKRFAYLVRTLSTLICACKFKNKGTYLGENSTFLNTSNPVKFPKVEEDILDLIKSDQIVENFVIKNGPNISTRESINWMYAHLCWDNEAMSDTLMKIVIQELCSKD